MKCRWFLLCQRDAVTTAPHPILGDVPICARCAERSGLLGEWLQHARDAERFGSEEPAKVADVLTHGKVQHGS